MAYNKVQMGDGTVFIDLTSDTVTASALQSGITAHDRSGAVITGTALEPESTALVKEDFDNNGGIIKDIFTVGDIPLIVTDTLDSGGGTIRTITADNVINLQAKKEDMATASVTVVGDSGYDGLSKVIASFSPNNQDKTATPSSTIQEITYDSDYSGLGIVTIEAIPSEYVVPSGSFLITENGAGYDIAQYATVDVNVSGGSGGSVVNQTKTAIPSEIQQVITYDSGYTGLESVTISAISSSYVGSGIDRNDSTDLTASGDTVTVPSGYYGAQASKSITSGSATTPATTITANPTISINSSTGVITAVASGSKSVTPTVSAGYVSSGTAGTISVSGSNTSELSTQTGATIAPTESEQTAVAAGKYTTGAVKVGAISSTYVGSGISQRTSASLTRSGATITAPAGYYAAAASSAVPNGTATAPSTISGTAATVSTGTNTLTLSKTVSVTPTVSTAGYISSGTAGNASVSLTATVSTKVAATITPGTSNQTIPSGTYLTGTQTIAGDADLVASNIVSGVQIFGVTGNVVLQNYYTGSSTPSSSLGSNGDLYLQS